MKRKWRITSDLNSIPLNIPFVIVSGAMFILLLISTKQTEQKSSDDSNDDDDDDETELVTVGCYYRKDENGISEHGVKYNIRFSCFFFYFLLWREVNGGTNTLSKSMMKFINNLYLIDSIKNGSNCYFFDFLFSFLEKVFFAPDYQC